MIYVSSDWHGYPLERVKELLGKAGFGSQDFLFLLGDVIDRGEEGIALLKYLMYQPNIELIRGNHEQMMLDCSFLFDEVTDETIDALDSDQMRAMAIWNRNGARPTLDSLAKELPDVRRMLLEYVEDTPLYDSVSVGGRDFLLTHAGLGTANGGALKDCTERDFLWTRPLLETRYSSEFTAIFGHTPTWFYGEEYRARILKTDTWIDIDVGAASGIAPALLRLDDMREFYLYE